MLFGSSMMLVASLATDSARQPPSPAIAAAPVGRGKLRACALLPIEMRCALGGERLSHSWHCASDWACEYTLVILSERSFSLLSRC